ncbi:MAG: hypothetical protein LC776_11700 [Acidobacteria bacterium]|nr:hypothetical protein [Acidobacteriota bacterium]
MYVYGFYKAVGLDAVEAFESAEARADLSHSTNRTFEGVLLGDLARSDVQAYLLYQLATPESDYEYAWGRTYLGAAALLIPQTIWPERPPTKVKEGTEVQYGMSAYHNGLLVSSRIYGLAGETMLNFGPIMVPLAFSLLGFIVGRVRYWLLAWDTSDMRLLLLPFLINLCFVVLTMDADNFLVILIKNFSVPFLVVFIGSTRLIKKPSVGSDTNKQVNRQKPPLLVAHVPNCNLQASS